MEKNQTQKELAQFHMPIRRQSIRVSLGVIVVVVAVAIAFPPKQSVQIVTGCVFNHHNCENG